MFCDAHAHLLDLRIYSQIDQILQKATADRVQEIAVCSSQQEEWQNLKNLEKYPHVIRLVGLHPWFLKKANHCWKQEFLSLLDKHHGVGEIGLDFWQGREDLVSQVEAFIFQFQQGQKRGMPVIIHQRKAWNELEALLKKDLKPIHPWLYHAFSGSREQLTQIINSHGLISLGGLLTRSNKLLDLVKYIPSDSLLLESDAPDQIQLGLAGEFSIPSHVVNLYRIVAHQYGISLEELALILIKNYKKLFKASFDS